MKCSMIVTDKMFQSEKKQKIICNYISTWANDYLQIATTIFESQFESS